MIFFIISFLIIILPIIRSIQHYRNKIDKLKNGICPNCGGKINRSKREMNNIVTFNYVCENNTFCSFRYNTVKFIDLHNEYDKALEILNKLRLENGLQKINKLPYDLKKDTEKYSIDFKEKIMQVKMYKYIILDNEIKKVKIIGDDGDSYYFENGYMGVNIESSAWYSDFYDTNEDAELALIEKLQEHIVKLNKELDKTNLKLNSLKTK